MSRKNDANKYWIYGEDAALAARFTKYLTKVLYARRASYIRDKMVEVSREISIEDCSGEVDDVYGRLTAPIEERVEAKLMWEGIRNYLPKLTPKECEVMIALYIDRLPVSEAAAKLGVAHIGVTLGRRVVTKWKVSNMIAFKELLVRAKRGEEKAFEELFEQFEPLVRKCSYMNGHTDEDLRQILLMEFVQAIRKFKI